MITSLKKINRFVADPVYQPMFLRDAPRPTTCEQISERFGFARALERIPHHRFDQIQHSDCDAPVGFDPISQVSSELGLEDCGSLTFPRHRLSLAVIQLRLPLLFLRVRLGATPPSNVVRSVATAAGGRSR